MRVYLSLPKYAALISPYMPYNHIDRGIYMLRFDYLSHIYLSNTIIKPYMRTDLIEAYMAVILII